MKLLFAHDHVFYKYNNKYYSTGGLSKEMLERYTCVFEEVVIISRQKKIGTYDNKLTLASTERVKFVEIPNFKSISSSYKIFHSKKIINNEVAECDSLIARLPSSIGSMAVSCAKKNNKPYLVEVVACAWDELWNHSIKGKIMAACNYCVTKTNIWNAPYVMYVTNEFLQHRYPTNGRSESCSNVALTEFSDTILENRLEKIRNLNKNSKLVIGTTAAIDVRYKGQQYVIKALGKLKKQGITNFEYQLVGGGEQTYLRSIAEKYGVIDQVRFLSSIPHDKVFDWLETIDIYVQPSRQEGLPRALIEAMSRGIPAFGAKTGGIPELLEDEYIFSNTRRNIDEICNILKSFNKHSMGIQAKRNYDESKKYDKNIIEYRRKKFFEQFVNNSKK